MRAGVDNHGGKHQNKQVVFYILRYTYGFLVKAFNRNIGPNDVNKRKNRHQRNWRKKLGKVVVTFLVDRHIEANAGE